MNFFQFARNQQNQSQSQSNTGQQSSSSAQNTGFGQHQFTGIHFIQKQPQSQPMNTQIQQPESPQNSFNLQEQQQKQTNSFNFQQNQQENASQIKNTTTTQNYSIGNPLDTLDSIENDLKILSIWTNQQEALLTKLLEDTKKLDNSLDIKIQQLN